jgi:aryl-alcohol dehydrogenase-like predicted oxidoreductase
MTVTTTTFTRPLGDSGPEVSAVGVGTWALGGPFTFDGRDAGWGEVDDAESVRALHVAIDAGVTLIDTAATYGTGHSERIVGRALATLPRTRRDAVVVATKFGLVFDEARRTGAGTDVRPATIRAECDASLRRLGVEAIGLYQLHSGAESAGQAEEVVATCEELLTAGKIRGFGTAQDGPEIVEVFARSAHCLAVQTQVNVFGWSAATLQAARTHGLAVLARSPLAMGLLSGKYSAAYRPAAGDVRLDTPWWDYFDADTMPGWLARLDAVREVLTSDGRTLAQGALAWIWARSPRTVPIPGFKTVAQVEENCGALPLGPLRAGQLAEIDGILGR